MNPFNIIQGLITKGMTPKGIAMKMMGNNPIFNNLVEMAEQGNGQGLETFARNFLKGKGLDYDTEMANFKKKFNIQ
jgi:hypothetical protein